MMRFAAGIRTGIYMAGFVALWVWLARDVRRFDPALGGKLPSWVPPFGFVAITAGGALALACGYLFVTRGRGTPAPFDPPRELVAGGPYRYVRNPMYIGGLLALGGFGLVERSPSILVLTLVVLGLVHLFVVLVEELRLEWRFGDSYRAYRRSVARWVPRLPRRR